MLLLSLLACGQPTPDDSALHTCDASGASHVSIVSRLTFARQIKDGVSWGFDLDGGDEDEGCDVADFVSPLGWANVDNAFSMLLPALELTEAEAIEPIIQESINTGGLMILLELEGLDDPLNDDCVDLHLLRGTGDVEVSAAGQLLPDQTFDRDLALPSADALDLAVKDGVVIAEGLDFTLPISFLDAELQFVLHDASLYVQLDEAGGASGLLAGSVEAADLISLASEQGIADEVVSTLETFLSLVSDIDGDGDGECERVSVTFMFESTPAYFYADSPYYE